MISHNLKKHVAHRIKGTGKKISAHALHHASNFLSEFTNADPSKHDDIIIHTMDSLIGADSLEGNDKDFDHSEFGKKLVLLCADNGIKVKVVPNSLKKTVADAFAGSNAKIHENHLADAYHVLKAQPDLDDEDIHHLIYDSIRDTVEDQQESGYTGEDFDYGNFGGHLKENLDCYRDAVEDKAWSGYDEGGAMARGYIIEDSSVDNMSGKRAAKKEARQERKAAKRSNRLAAKSGRKAQRQSRRQAKVDAKTQRKMSRAQRRADKKMLKTTARQDRKDLRRGRRDARKGISHSETAADQTQTSIQTTMAQINPSPSADVQQAGTDLSTSAMQLPPPSSGGGSDAGGASGGGGGSMPDAGAAQDSTDQSGDQEAPAEDDGSGDGQQDTSNADAVQAYFEAMGWA